MFFMFFMFLTYPPGFLSQKWIGERQLRKASKVNGGLLRRYVTPNSVLLRNWLTASLVRAPGSGAG
jgi:hypothetical protein